MKKRIITAMMLTMAVAAMTACSKSESSQMTQEEMTQMGEEMAEEADAMSEEMLEETESMTGDFLEDYVGEMELEGTWTDEISGRAEMDITALEDSTYDVLVHWGSSASEAAIWEFTGSYDPASGNLSYTDAKHYTLVFNEDGEETVKDETTTEGALLKEGDKLRWQDSANEEDCIFVNVSSYNGVDGVYVNEKSDELVIREVEDGFDVILTVDGKEYAGTLMDVGEGFTGDLTEGGEDFQTTILMEDGEFVVTLENGEIVHFRKDQIQEEAAE